MKSYTYLKHIFTFSLIILSFLFPIISLSQTVYEDKNSEIYTFDDAIKEMRRRMEEWQRLTPWELDENDFFKSPFEKTFEDILKKFNAFDTYNKKFKGLNNNFSKLIPKTDIIEKGTNLIITIDLPGQTKESIDLRIKDNTLIITSERKQMVKEVNEKQQIYKKEISYGTFQRVIPLPKKIIEDKIVAKYENGTLTVIAPIDQSATITNDIEKGKKIDIQ